jgi:hypothetical protein
MCEEYQRLQEASSAVERDIRMSITNLHRSTNNPRQTARSHLREHLKRPVKCMLQGSLSSGDFRKVNDGEAVFSGSVGGLGGRAV